MSEIAFKQLASKVDLLSYEEKIKLLDKIVGTLHAPVKTSKTKPANLSLAFGLWKERDISIEKIRTEAWGRQ